MLFMMYCTTKCKAQYIKGQNRKKVLIMCHYYIIITVIGIYLVSILKVIPYCASKAVTVMFKNVLWLVRIVVD